MDGHRHVQAQPTPAIRSEAVNGTLHEATPTKRLMADAGSVSPKSKRMKTGVIQRLNAQGHFEPVEQLDDGMLPYKKGESGGDSAVESPPGWEAPANGLRLDEIPYETHQIPPRPRAKRLPSSSITTPAKAPTPTATHSSATPQGAVIQNAVAGPSRYATPPQASDSRPRNVDGISSSTSRLSAPILAEKEANARRPSGSLPIRSSEPPEKQSSKEDASWRVRKLAEARVVREAQSRQAEADKRKRADNDEVVKLREPFSTTVSFLPAFLFLKLTLRQSHTYNPLAALAPQTRANVMGVVVEVKPASRTSKGGESEGADNA